MGNCLVTKLKGVVNNDNLPLFDAVILQVREVDNPTDASQWFNFIHNGASPISAEIVGDGYFIQGSSYAEGVNVGKVINDITDTTNSPYYYLSNGEYKVIIRGKYNINVITMPTCITFINLDELVYNNITGVNDRGGSFIGDMDVIKLLNYLSRSSNTEAFYATYGTLEALMTSTRIGLVFYSINPLSEGYGRLTGNIEAAANSKDTLIELDISGNDGVYGNIAALGQCTHLENLYVFRGCSISGTIEDLVAAFRANGKTSGSINTQIYDDTGKCSVTFNGQLIPSDRVTEPLVWTATTITCNGVTIEA